MKKCLLVVLVLTGVVTGALGAAPAAHAEIYRWTDSAGEKHFADEIGKVPDEYRDQVDEVTDEVRERDRANLTAEQTARQEKMKAAPPPPPPGNATDAAIQETLVKIFTERGIAQPTKDEAADFVRLVRVWLAPMILSVLLIMGLGVGLTIHALINNKWVWVGGSIAWLVVTFFIGPSNPAAVFEAPLLWCIVSYLYVLPILAYPPFNVGQDDREYLRWLIPAVAICAVIIAISGTIEGIEWTRGMMESRGLEVPGPATAP